MRHISFKLFAEGCEKLSLLPSKQTWEPWEQPWAPTERMPNKPGPGSAGSVENPLLYMKATCVYLILLLQTLQVLLRLSWSQTFRNTWGAHCQTTRAASERSEKTHSGSQAKLSPQSSRNPPQSASRLSRNVWQKSTYCVHSPAGLTLPLCHLDFIRFINMCSLPQAHSICPAHVNVSVFLGTFSPLRW